MRHTAAELAALQARRERFVEDAARWEEDHPSIPVGELWRMAGGGTSRFSQARFSGLVQTERWTGADPCDVAVCGDRPPHLCWWSAIRASVLEARRTRRTVSEPSPEMTLF